jgi:hypothetical protein
VVLSTGPNHETFDRLPSFQTAPPAIVELIAGAITFSRRGLSGFASLA